MTKRMRAPPKAFASSVGEPKSRRRYAAKSKDVLDRDFYDQDNVSDNEERYDSSALAEDESKLVIEDDEDLDDDEAFNEEDQLRWGHLFPDSNAKEENGDGDDNAEDGSNDDDDDSIDDEDAIDISELLSSSETKSSIADRLLPQSDDEEDDVDLGDFSHSDDDDNDDEDEKLNQLGEVLQSLDASGRKLPTARPPPPTLITKPFKESEFRVPLAVGAEAKLLSLSSLMANADGDMGLSHVRQQVRQLESSSQKRVVEVPLPSRMQDKIERKAAYVKTATEISRWTPIIQKNRKAPNLQFPINETNPSVMTNASLTASFRPETNLEKQIQSILVENGMANERDILASETLALNRLDPEQVKANRIELQKMRSLLFFAERKQKHASKIKSKKYHKILKREKEKTKLTMEQMEALDPEMAHDEQVKAERGRAEERISLRHKLSNKWSKTIGKFHDVDKGGREAILDKLDQHDKLMQKMSGDDDNEDGDEVSRVNGTSASLNGSTTLQPPNNEKLPGKGLFELNFMKRAMTADRLAAKQTLADAERSWLPSDEIDSQANSSMGKRVKFGNAASKSSATEAENALDDLRGRGFYRSDSEDENGVDVSSPPADRHLPTAHSHLESSTRETADLRGQSSLNFPSADSFPDLSSSARAVEEESNPWLTESAETTRTSTKRTADELRASKSLDRHEKQLQKRTKAAASFEPSTETVIDVSTSVLPSSNQEMLVNEDEHQHKMVQMAFANDESLIHEFTREKQQDIVSDTPKIIDATLPGWGSWSGSGITNTPRKRVLIPPQPGDGIEAEQRKDFHLAHVIINEKKNKSFSKLYTAASTPFPYQTAAQYEAAIRNPLGREWNTIGSHQKFIQPKVTTKLGTIIEPIKYVKQPKDAKSAQQMDDPRNIRAAFTKRESLTSTGIRLKK